jgi:membrane protein required for colicin V production
MITGLLRSVFDIVGIIAGYVLAINFCEMIEIPRYLALLLIFIVVAAVFSITGRFIARAIHKTPIGVVDRLLGGVLGLLKAFVVCFVFLLMLNLLSKNNRTLNRSEIAPWVLKSGVSASRVLPRRWYEWIKKTTAPREVAKWDD